MCGIIGITYLNEISNSSNNIISCLLESLKLLEYKGYDSTGIATIQPDVNNTYIHRVRQEGKITHLE